MNDDIYAEWLVKRKDEWWTVPAMIGMGVLVLIALILTMRTGWGFIVLIAVVFGIFYFVRFLHVEYEYVFVTNELNIDKIFTQQIRKTAVTIEMSSVESVEPTNEEKNKNRLMDKNIRFHDFTSGMKDAKSYTMVYNAEGATHLLVFEPNEKVLKAMWRCSPSKIHQ